MQDFQRQVVNVHVSDALLDYLQALVRFSRESGEFETGLSPRAALALLSAARAWAFMAGRRGVVPEDLQTILPGVVAHRVRLRDNPATGRARSASARLLEAVAIP
jgi:MoxR-like ATPase